MRDDAWQCEVFFALSNIVTFFKTLIFYIDAFEDNIKFFWVELKWVYIANLFCWPKTKAEV